MIPFSCRNIQKGERANNRLCIFLKNIDGIVPYHTFTKQHSSIIWMHYILVQHNKFTFMHERFSNSLYLFYCVYLWCKLCISRCNIFRQLSCEILKCWLACLKRNNNGTHVVCIHYSVRQGFSSEPLLQLIVVYADIFDENSFWMLIILPSNLHCRPFNYLPHSSAFPIIFDVRSWQRFL